jgi:hypothetical protein
MFKRDMTCEWEMQAKVASYKDDNSALGALCYMQCAYVCMQHAAFTAASLQPVTHMTPSGVLPACLLAAAAAAAAAATTGR